MAESGIQVFVKVLSQYKRMGSWAAAITIIGPLMDFTLKVGPPWPGSSAVLTSLTQFITLILVFEFGQKRRKKVAGLLTQMAIITVVLFAAYLFTVDRYTFTSPINDQRYVKGYELRPDVAKLLRNDFTEDDALQGSEYNPSAIWTPTSISIMKVTLLLLWLAFFAGLASIVGTFIVHNRVVSPD